MNRNRHERHVKEIWIRAAPTRHAHLWQRLIHFFESDTPDVLPLRYWLGFQLAINYTNNAIHTTQKLVALKLIDLLQHPELVPPLILYTMSQLPTSNDLFRKGLVLAVPNEEDHCPICFDDFEQAVELPCSLHHIVCRECIKRWRETDFACPLYRLDVYNKAYVTVVETESEADLRAWNEFRVWRKHLEASFTEFGKLDAAIRKQQEQKGLSVVDQEARVRDTDSDGSSNVIIFII